MSKRAFTRCWLHLIWGTKRREKMLPREARRRVSTYLSDYAHSKAIYMRANYVNADHVHTLIDLPAQMPVSEAAKLLKGSSSHWINKHRIIAAKFSWARGYGAFSVSQSNVADVVRYIERQETHHERTSFQEEYEAFAAAYDLGPGNR